MSDGPALCGPGLLCCNPLASWHVYKRDAARAVGVSAGEEKHLGRDALSCSVAMLTAVVPTAAMAERGLLPPRAAGLVAGLECCPRLSPGSAACPFSYMIIWIHIYIPVHSQFEQYLRRYCSSPEGLRDASGQLRAPITVE